MIIYTALFSLILFIIVRLFWQVQLSSVRGEAIREIKENAIQVSEILKHAIREADDVDVDASIFGSSPGKLVLENDSNITISTYTKNVILGEQPFSIRKLRFLEVGQAAVDLTSDHVDVTNIQFTNLTQGSGQDVVLIDLTLSSLNPSSDEIYDHSFALRSSVTLRKD